MNARVPTKSAMQEIQEEYEESLKKMQEEYVRCLVINTENAQNNAIKLCVVTGTASLVDVGLADTTIEKIFKKWKSYIDSVRKGNVDWQEIATTLKEEEDITFDWMGD
jgi:hypothetical protein